MARRGRGLGGTKPDGRTPIGIVCPEDMNDPAWNHIMENVVVNPYAPHITKAKLVAGVQLELGMADSEAKQLTKTRLQNLLVGNRFRSKTYLGFKVTYEARIGTAPYIAEDPHEVVQDGERQLVHPFFVTMSPTKNGQGRPYRVLAGEYCMLGLKYRFSPQLALERRVVRSPFVGHNLFHQVRGRRTLRQDGFPAPSDWRSVEGYPKPEQWMLMSNLERRRKRMREEAEA